MPANKEESPWTPPAVHELASILLVLDPMRLRAHGVPDDEYMSEARTILPRLAGCREFKDVQAVVHEEFVHWFGARSAGTFEDYYKTADGVLMWWSVRGHKLIEFPNPADSPTELDAAIAKLKYDMKLVSADADSPMRSYEARDASDSEYAALDKQLQSLLAERAAREEKAKS